jgi:hypothetical protein
MANIDEKKDLIDSFWSKSPLWAQIMQGVTLLILGLPDILPQIEPILTEYGINVPAKYRVFIAILSLFILQFTKKKSNEKTN